MEEKVRLVTVFKDLVEREGSLLELTTQPTILNAITFRLGDLLHGRGFDTILAFEPIGFSLSPLLSVMEMLPYIWYIDGKPSREPTKDERLVVLCGQLSLKDIKFLDKIAATANISIVTALLDSGDSPNQNYFSMYRVEDLLK